MFDCSLKNLLQAVGVGSKLKNNENKMQETHGRTGSNFLYLATKGSYYLQNQSSMSTLMPETFCLCLHDTSADLISTLLFLLYI